MHFRNISILPDLVIVSFRVVSNIVIKRFAQVRKKLNSQIYFFLLNLKNEYWADQNLGAKRLETRGEVASYIIHFEIGQKTFNIFIYVKNKIKLFF